MLLADKQRAQLFVFELGQLVDRSELLDELPRDYDSRGELGISPDGPPGYTQVRYTVTVTSPASEMDVLRVLDTADRYSPYRDVFARAHDVRRLVRIASPQS